MTITRKILGLISGVMAGVIGASVCVTLFLGIASYWEGGIERVEMRLHAGQDLGLNSMEWIALIFALSAGFWSGFTVWALFARRMGWFTLEELLELLQQKRS